MRTNDEKEKYKFTDKDKDHVLDVVKYNPDLYWSEKSFLKTIDERGNKYGRSIVLDYAGQHAKKSQVVVVCQCECGNKYLADLFRLKNGETKTCGCAHGRSKLEQQKWRRFKRIAEGIIRRCDNPEETGNVRYSIYGGRGIKNKLGKTMSEVRDSLLKVPGYFDGAQIDRIDNDGDYTLHHPEHGTEIWEFYDKNVDKTFQCLGNLRWVTCAENARNKSTYLDVTTDLMDKPREIKDVLRIIANRPNLNLHEFTMMVKSGNVRMIHSSHYTKHTLTPLEGEKKMTYIEFSNKYKIQIDKYLSNR